MMTVCEGPLIVAPEIWTVVFNREAATWWASGMALGRYKHVRAYAYVPFLHVWVFYDVRLRGTEITIAADGAPADHMIASWIVAADLLRVHRRPHAACTVPVLGFCVPAMRRLLGVPGSALRPDAFWRECLRHGAEPFEAVHGYPAVQRPAA